MLTRCVACYGSGKMMGSGMIQHDCDACDGVGKVDKTDYAASEVYKEARDEIMREHNISESEAATLLDNAINKVKPKRGRPKRV